MSQDYHYANHDRLEYFDIGVRKHSSSLSGLGHGFGARALALLLWDGTGNPPDPLAGRWARDRISAQSDYRIEQNEPPTDEFATWSNLDSDVFLMLVRTEREQFLPFVLSDRFLTFVAGELVLNQGARWLEFALHETLGANWKELYFQSIQPTWQSPAAVPRLLVPDLADKSK